MSAEEAAARQTALDTAQQLAFEDLPFVPLGLWRPKNAYRKDITGFVQCDISPFWNVRRV